MKINSSSIKKYSSLINPLKDKNKPIYRWHQYKHSFSEELVNDFIKEFELNNNSWVLDPFVGSGTTLLACKEKGINGIGYDISPFAIFLSNTKLSNYNKGELTNLLEKLYKFLTKNHTKSIFDFPDIPLIKKAYSKSIWNEILFIKREILKIANKNNRDFFLLALFSILESVSNTTKSGGFLRITKRNITKKMVIKKFFHYATVMIKDLGANKTKRNGHTAIARLGDARKYSIRRKFDAIITSPPYLNRHDYTRIYALELVLNFIKNNAGLKELRYNTLRSHVEAKLRFSTNGYVKPKILSKIINEIESNGTNNSQIIGMITGYFEDMYLCLKEMKRVLTKNGKIALVVSNVRFSGINILVDEILGKLGEKLGLKLIEIRVARYRGNSSQQMRDYKRDLSRESIILWSN